MSIWGKIIGGAAGFALGGPIGALLGAMAGHSYDRAREGGAPGTGGIGMRQTAFTVAVIALGAKLAKADGRVTRDEIETFRRIFRIPDVEAGAVGRIFNEARREASGYEPYAEQIAAMFRHAPGVLEDFLDALFLIAKADGHVHPAELEFLERVAQIFGFRAADFARIREGHMGAGSGDAYAILGVKSDISDGELKKAYRKLVREHHPDTLIAQGLPQEFVDVANDKLAVINDAYDRVEKERGLK